MGTPQFAARVLESVIDDVVLVVTQPDKINGRNNKTDFSPVKKLAQEKNIPLFQPVDIRTDFQKVLDFNPDLILTCAYGQIIPAVLLHFPRFKCVNVHASLLPALRGGAPIHKSIIYGHNETGITLMYMAKKMDAGDILWQEAVPIDFMDTALTLHDKLIKLSIKMLKKYLPEIFEGRVQPKQQDHLKATYAYNISREEELIDWHQNSLTVYNQIRGLYSWPLAYTRLEDKIIKIHSAEITEHESSAIPGTIICPKQLIIKTKDKAIRIITLQPAGKKVMSAKDFINGNKIVLNSILK